MESEWRRDRDRSEAGAERQGDAKRKRDKEKSKSKKWKQKEAAGGASGGGVAGEEEEGSLIEMARQEVADQRNDAYGARVLEQEEVAARLARLRAAKAAREQQAASEDAEGGADAEMDDA